MTEPIHSEQPSEPKSRTGAIIAAVVVILVIAAAALAWWLTADNEEPVAPSPSASITPSATPSPTPSVTPSASPSPTPSETMEPVVFSDVEGRWCPTSPPDWEDVCFTVTLPEVNYEHEEEDDWGPSYVIPWEREPGSEPADWEYDFGPEPSGCFSAAIDSWPSESGAAFDFCPAGASDSENISSVGDVTVDRVYIAQELDTYPYVRADE